MSIMRILNTVILISLGLLMQGCMGGKDSILPQDGPTMKQVYESHFNGETIDQHLSESDDSVAEQDETAEAAGSSDANSNIKAGLIARRHDNETDLSGYTRTAHNEIKQIFPRLKNKTLIMYIFPHLSKRERHPVPGYSTAFTMYKQTEYALPGEMEEGY